MCQTKQGSGVFENPKGDSQGHSKVCGKGIKRSSSSGCKEMLKSTHRLFHYMHFLGTF